MEEKEGRVLLIKHNNRVNMANTEIASEGIFYSYNKNNELLRPYEPFLDIIKEYVLEQAENNALFSEMAFFEKAEVYPVHRDIFHGYFHGEFLMRREELLIGEYSYEEKEFRYAVLNMLEIVMAERKTYIVLDYINGMGRSVVWMLTQILEQSKFEHINVVCAYNEEREILPYSKDEVNAFIKMCEDKNLVDQRVAEDEEYDQEDDESNGDTDAANISIEETLHIFNDLIHTFEIEQADYFLKLFNDKLNREKSVLNVEQRMHMVTIGFFINIVNKDYIEALHLCNMMLKTMNKEDKSHDKYVFRLICHKALVYIYRGDVEQVKKELAKGKKIAEKYKDEKMLFLVELYATMMKLNGWNDVWICEKNIPVSKSLIKNCIKYNFMNHLAYIYAYNFDCDREKFETVEGLEEKLVHFNKGIEIGKNLRNRHFLTEAYRKNVVLASISGHFNVCIYFYKKMLKINEANRDEIVEAGIYNGLGYSACGLERFEEANQYYSKALVLYEKNQMVDEIVETLYNLGINAIQAWDYDSAYKYLVEADYILDILKKSTLKTCDLPKLYGLIALSSYRAGAIYQARLYINKSKQFLSYVLGTPDEEEIYIADDSMFLVYLVSALLKCKEGKYTEAQYRFNKARFYMQRSKGSLFINYIEYIYDYYTYLINIGDVKSAEKELNDFKKYCTINNYAYKLENIEGLVSKRIRNRNINKGSMMISNISLKALSAFVKKKREENIRVELENTIRFMDIMQKFLNHMSYNIDDEISTLIPILKNYLLIDRVVLIRNSSEQGELLYSDLEYELEKEKIELIWNYLNNRKIPFLVSKDGMIHEEYKAVLDCFEQKNVFSFAAIPILENDRLMGIAIVHTEIKNSWNSKKEKGIIVGTDLEIFTYIFSQIYTVLTRLEVEKELVETNKKINEQIQQVLELKKEADVANETKSNFVANMSHEIRTPINAIIGMAEVTLRGELSKEQRENIEQIKTSSKALLTIINDVLDFSKIESGKMELILDEYNMHSMIQDVSNIAMSRIGNKKLDFVVDVDPHIPRQLIGDSGRIRQIIINIVNNAIKFANEGWVKLSIGHEKMSDGRIMLTMAVEDTGIGIKQQDLPALFTSFQQVDSKRNRNIEGTGLGLSITKQLLALMDGDITVESEYEKGSTFTCVFPQEVAKTEESKNKATETDLYVVYYVSNINIKNQLKKDLIRLGIGFEMATDELQLTEMLVRKPQYVIVDDEVINQAIVDAVRKNTQSELLVLSNPYKAKTGLMDNIRVLKKPVSSYDLENVLLGVEDLDKDAKAQNKVFVAPDAKILIVDDNTVNLKVAVSLLEPYKMQIETAISGKEAIEKIGNKKYDIVFMDHMMPGLDGVDTTHVIRRYHPEYNEIPIIALTANAVAGMKEFFISEGMNDFIPKPIDLSVFVDKILKWLPKDKIIEVKDDIKADSAKSSTLKIDGLDVEYAIKLLGNEKIFRKILEEYYNTIEKKSKLIAEYESTGEVKAYTIEVHALKSASRQVGALTLADKCEKLEYAGKNNDIDYIHSETEEMLKHYRTYAETLKPYFVSSDSEDEKNKEMIDNTVLDRLLNELTEAMYSLDLTKMDTVIKEMDQYEYQDDAKTQFEQLKAAVGNIDIEACEEIINKWRN